MAHKGKLFPIAPGRDLNLAPWPIQHFGTKYRWHDYSVSGTLAPEYADGIRQVGDVEYDRVNGALTYRFEPVHVPHITNFYVKFGGSQDFVRNFVFSGELYISGHSQGVVFENGGQGPQGQRLVGLSFFSQGGFPRRLVLNLGLMVPLLWAEL
jgi:hypothetical protein